ncbi:MAG: ROK family protein [Selenomonas sp.]|nr:ROK family protein [Selenomonas sp.]
MDKRDMRRANLDMLRRVLMDLGQATKPQLAEASGFSVVTVNALLKTLVEAGEAEAVEAAALPGEAGGRPARQFAFCRNRKLALLLYMFEERGKDKLVLAVENLLGEIIWQQEVFPPEITAEVLLAHLQQAREQFPGISRVLLGVPGVDVAGRMMIIDYPRLQGIALRERLSEALALPVHICNDINAAVMGYGRQWHQAEQETVIGIYWPHGYPPGAGILLKGRLYEGKDGIAGEIGFRYANSAPYREGDFKESAAAEILRLVRYWNPHQVVFYREGLTEAALALIMAACREELPAVLLPEVRLGASFQQDYAAGLRQIGRNLLLKD